MKALSITEFRRTCLQVVDHLPAEGITLTKRGRAVATVVPVRRDPRALIGILPDLIVDPNDDLFSTGLRWDAES